MDIGQTTLIAIFIFLVIIIVIQTVRTIYLIRENRYYLPEQPKVVPDGLINRQRELINRQRKIISKQRERLDKQRKYILMNIKQQNI